jgi:choline dehydrogenase-like flavoprotein
MGAAGGTIAAELARRGLDVVAIESGPDHRSALPERDFHDDEVAHIVERRLLSNEPEAMVLSGRRLRDTPWLARNTGVGGPLVWSGFAYRFHPSDFRVASECGVPDGSSVADWPVSYDDLAPWYTRAEQLFGVDAGNPLPWGRSGALFADAARRCGLHPYRPPAAILQRDAGERLACNRCGQCTYYGCSRGAKASTLVTALRGVSLRVHAHCTAVEVCTDRGGMARAVRYLDVQGNAVEQPARTVVLAANAPYVARLLLLSRSRAHPHGAGNGSDQVGRHLTFHTGVMAWGVFDEVLDSVEGPQPHGGVDDYNESRPYRDGAAFRRGGVLHGGMPAAFTGGPLAFARALDVSIPLPDGVPRYGDGLLRFAAHAYLRHMAVYGLGEDLPRPDNRVVLDDTLRDRHGLPALRIEYTPHPDDVAQKQFLVARAEELLLSAGAHTVASDAPELPAGMFAGHAHGTTRMGTDPATSVADDSGRVHGVDNLFVAGAGLFVTSAGLNPALTIVALALRSVDAIAATAPRPGTPR